MGRLDQKTLVITPSATVKTVPANLKALDTHIRPDGSLAITYRTSQTTIPALLATLKSANIDITDLRTEEPDLEDVFMALTYDLENS